MNAPPAVVSVRNDNASAMFSPQQDATRSVSTFKITASKIDTTERVTIPFYPPVIVTALKNEFGQRIVELCVWLPSGIDLRNMSVHVADDMKHLKIQFLMDLVMANPWFLHRDLIPGAENIRKEDRRRNVRVCHWDDVIEELKTDENHLPRFATEIELPEEVCTKKFLRKVGKGSDWGSKFLLIDLLVEDSKKPAAGSKRSFDLLSKDDLDIDDDDLTLTSN